MESAGLDPDTVSYLQKGMRDYTESCTYHSLNRDDLLFLNWGRYIANSNDSRHAWNLQYGDACMWGITTEDVAREQRHLDLLYAVRPAASGFVQREKPFVPMIIQQRRHSSFVRHLYLDGEPVRSTVRRLD